MENLARGARWARRLDLRLLSAGSDSYIIHVLTIDDLSTEGCDQSLEEEAEKAVL